MNSPLTLDIFSKRFPIEIINRMQIYLKNDNVYDAINKYMVHLYEEQYLHDEYIHRTFILPNCYCHRLPGQIDCWVCDEGYENTLPNYLLCITENTQFIKIKKRED
jgi:hypothetical protein